MKGNTITNYPVATAEKREVRSPYYGIARPTPSPPPQPQIPIWDAEEQLFTGHPAEFVSLALPDNVQLFQFLFPFY